MKPDGAFVFREVPEGSYRISFVPLPAGFYLRSAGAADVLETGTNVGRGHVPAALDLVTMSGTGRIDGTVESDDKLSPGASVVLVPEGKRSALPNFYRQAVADQLGRFALRNIVPGDYTLFAWERIESDAFMDSDFLGRYEDRGKAVHVEEDGHVSAQLELVTEAETVP